MWGCDGQPAAGWVVNASNPAAPATITPSQVTTVNPGTADFALSKVVAAGSTTTVAPPSGQTGAQGQLGFALSKVLAGGSPLTLTETLQPGFSFQGATCVEGEQQNVPINFNGLAGTLTVN